MTQKLPADIQNAKTPGQFYRLLSEYTNSKPTIFVYRRCYYHRQGIENPKFHCVSNFIIKPLYYDLNKSNPSMPLSKLSVKIIPQKGEPTTCTFRFSDIATPEKMKQTFMDSARVIWTGERAATNALLRKISGTEITIIRQLDTIGYDPEINSFVFRDYMINRDGSMCLPEQNGFCVSDLNCVRPPDDFPESIKPDFDSQIDPKTSYNYICNAWPHNANGEIALSWLVASWYLYVIKPKLTFFPFLSLYGDPATGKSNLCRFMNYLQGFSNEGLPMSKFNTGKGELREIASKSSLVTALLESQGQGNQRFDIGTILTIYNDGNALQTRAATSNDKRRYKLDFKGSLMFVQNHERFTDSAQKSRVISLHFDKEKHITSETTLAYEKLINVPRETFPLFYIHIMKHRQFIEKNWLDYFKTARNEIQKEIPDARISENYGILLAFNRLIKEVL